MYSGNRIRRELENYSQTSVTKLSPWIQDSRYEAILSRVSEQRMKYNLSFRARVISWCVLNIWRWTRNFCVLRYDRRYIYSFISIELLSRTSYLYEDVVKIFSSDQEELLRAMKNVSHSTHAPDSSTLIGLLYFYDRHNSSDIDGNRFSEQADKPIVHLHNSCLFSREDS